MSQGLGRSSSFGPDMGRKLLRQVRQIRSMSFRRTADDWLTGPVSHQFDRLCGQAVKTLAQRSGGTVRSPAKSNQRL
ncbi:hypothetical protein ElyMa_002739800 [Elysia marginata]|uniref:Uncharacterized protein n=1 Tax=Elysia marginata TaxID=1093978 RepID=A0AAV4HJA5_9GAST|nr:hypothetical protein ElyMa_002739800 [Elysia marginata]